MVPLLHVKPRPGQRYPAMLPAQPPTAGSGSHVSPMLRHPGRTFGPQGMGVPQQQQENHLIPPRRPSPTCALNHTT